MVKITEEDKKILEKFPEYKDGDAYVGSRNYWEGVFEFETNRDPELHKAFSELHTRIINEVLEFCREHGIKDVDEVYIQADGLIGSIPYGEWCACTDSSMSMIVAKKDGEGWVVRDRENPFLYEI